MTGTLSRVMTLKVFQNALVSAEPEQSIRDVLLQGFDINKVDAAGQTLLDTVLGDVEKARLLVKYGINPFIGSYHKKPESTTIDVINIANERSLDRFIRFIDVLRRYNGKNDVYIPYRGTILTNAISTGDYLLVKVALIKGVSIGMSDDALIEYADKCGSRSEMMGVLNEYLTSRYSRNGRLWYIRMPLE